MDWTVYPNTPISRLPRLLRYPALLVRNIVFLFRRQPEPSPVRGQPAFDYVYEADGIATVYYSPFQHDREWSAAYDEMASEWYLETPGLDIRWRMWILTSMARQARASAPTRLALEYAYERLVPAASSSSTTTATARSTTSAR